METKQYSNRCLADTSLTRPKIFYAGYLGIIPYEKALKLQTNIMQARIDGRIPDVLLLLQHPPVLTIGRFHGRSDILVSQEHLRQEEISIFHTNRGGSVTYHGPGQLVGYPIINLRENRISVREYVRLLEEMVIKTLYVFGIEGKRVLGYPGVWANNRKICSIGIHISRYVTMHGFALNINTNLNHFSYINPCGNSGISMTSISDILGFDVEFETVRREIIRSFATVFESQFKQGFCKCAAILDALNG